MDHNVVMEPTERGKVVGVVASAFGVLDDMVGLQPVHRYTAINDTCLVTMSYMVAYCRRDMSGCSACGYGETVCVESDDLYATFTQQLLEGVWSDTWTVRNFGGGLGGIVLACVDKHSDVGNS